MRVDVNIVRAFSYNNTGGNKAGVVLNADILSAKQKQELAGKVGLSETAFVSSSDKADFKLEFFTPSNQIAHCGHATIATFAYLKQLRKIKGEISSKETIDGTREIRFIGGEVYMEQKAPIFTQPENEDVPAILHSIGLHEAATCGVPVFINTGNSFMVLEVTNESTLSLLKPDYESITHLMLKYNLTGYYIFSKAENPEFDASTRMFAPAIGIDEESATGMAAGPLAAYLYHNKERKTDYKIAQGYFMKEPSPSLINVKVLAKNGVIKSLFAGGSANVAEVISLDVDEVIPVL